MTAWIVPLVKAPAGALNLFCFAYAGGGSAAFRPWKTHLPAAISLYSIQLPGRENRFTELPLTDLKQMIAPIVHGLLPELATVPYAFFGHSMGAIIAFEVTRQLQRQQAPLPRHLLVSGKKAPQSANILPPIQHLPDQAFIQALNDRYGGIDPLILQHRELLDLLLPVLRGDITAIENYCYQPDIPLACPITAYGGRQDPQVTLADLEAWREQTQYPSLFQAHLLEGGHFFINESRTALLAHILSQLTSFPS